MCKLTSTVRRVTVLGSIPHDAAKTLARRKLDLVNDQRTFNLKQSVSVYCECQRISTNAAKHTSLNLKSVEVGSLLPNIFNERFSYRGPMADTCRSCDAWLRPWILSEIIALRALFRCDACLIPWSF